MPPDEATRKGQDRSNFHRLRFGACLNCRRTLLLYEEIEALVKRMLQVQGQVYQYHDAFR